MVGNRGGRGGAVVRVEGVCSGGALIVGLQQDRLCLRHPCMQVYVFCGLTWLPMDFEYQVGTMESLPVVCEWIQGVPACPMEF